MEERSGTIYSIFSLAVRHKVTEKRSKVLCGSFRCEFEPFCHSEVMVCLEKDLANGTLSIKGS